jgi:hypothetical protein
MTRREILRAALAPVGRLLAYAACFVAASGLVAVGQRLDHADLTVPLLTSGDALLILPMVVSQHEGGTHWVNDRMGAPGRQEFYDFPVIDHLHFAAIAVLDKVLGDPIVAMNVYYLLTYPLVAVCAMLAGRLLWLSIPAAFCLGLLYSFLPYHEIRGFSHYFLSAYYLVPLGLVVAVHLTLDRIPARRLAWPVILMLAISAAGAYYAFFGCVMLAAGGLYGALLRRKLRPLVLGALLSGVVVAGGLANHLPSYLYQRQFGHNTRPVQRTPEDTEWYGLKMTYLVLPVDWHRVPALARWRSAYDSTSRPIQVEANTTTLGGVGVAGLIIAAVAVFHPRPRRGRRVRRAVAALLGIAFLVATVGGVGALFSELVTASIRAQARMVVVIAFLALWLAVAALDRLRPRLWPLHVLAFALLTGLGLLDTTQRDWGHWSRVKVRHDLVRHHLADAKFYGDIEATLGGGAVFQLPFNEFPEGAMQPGVGVGSNDFARGFLHTKSTRWSFGAMKGREADQWQREVASAEAPEMLRRLVMRGFDGLCLDLRGLKPEQVDALRDPIRAALNVSTPTLVNEAEPQEFYDLRPYRERLMREMGPRYGELAKDEAEAIRVLWFRGFTSFEPLGREDAHRWCGRRGEAWVVNPTDRTRRVTLTFVARTEVPTPSRLRVEGDIWSEAFDIDSSSGVHAVTLAVPPGRHRVNFACDPPPDWLPRDSRRHVFFLSQFRLTADD